jgi:hypothetical protein
VVVGVLGIHRIPSLGFFNVLVDHLHPPHMPCGMNEILLMFPGLFYPRQPTIYSRFTYSTHSFLHSSNIYGILVLVLCQVLY